MQPTNLKHLFHVLIDSIEQLRSGQMTVAKGQAISDLAARANTAVKVNHDRERLIMEIESHKARFPSSKAELRNIEGKNFD